jgi:ElaB/YqjD/DUF883 family membrane-anchored ribosome-binding protein
MNASTKSEPDLAVLQDDMAALKRDVASLIEHLRAGATSGAHNAADYLDDGARRLYRTMAAESQRSAKALGEQVEEHPLAALLIALGVGYVSGRFLSR